LGGLDVESLVGMRKWDLKQRRDMSYFLQAHATDTACPLLSARVVIRLSHRLHKGCNFFWSLSREKTGGERGEEGREHCEAI